MVGRSFTIRANPTNDLSLAMESKPTLLGYVNIEAINCFFVGFFFWWFLALIEELLFQVTPGVDKSEVKNHRRGEIIYLTTVAVILFFF